VSRLTDLIAQVEESNPALADDLRREAAVLSARRPFGLNFERHQPETVQLPEQKIRRGNKVAIRPQRGDVDAEPDRRTWIVTGFKGKGAKRKAELILRGEQEVQTETRPLSELVVVAEFRDPIYPGLRSTGTIERGGDHPFHTVINGENFHVLEALTFTHEGEVDCIYIDPPYNSGASDWKYDNAYVDENDAYRHSKWLAMIERRLKLTKRLLNPARSVLVVTIDEREYLRLGLLLHQLFPAAKIQMVTTVIKPSGSVRGAEFSRVDEYIFFVFIGSAKPAETSSDMLRSGDEDESSQVTWHGLRRRGSTDWKREKRPGGFYPVFIRKKDGAFHSVGDPLQPDQDRKTATPPRGAYACWPLSPTGAEGRWQITPKRFREQLKAGTLVIKSSDPKKETCSVSYLKSGTLQKIEDGELTITGRQDDGRVILVAPGSVGKRAKTVWNQESHDASANGTALLTRFVGERKFPFPKSLYAVEDTLRFFVKDNPDALVLDFFAGSGTTTHAVARLNRQDGGRRRSIAVTNNEVSVDETQQLREEGRLPGDPEWESLGIFEHITCPRITAAITGLTPEGEPIKGEYRFTDEFPMEDGFEENVEFFELTYEDPERVRHGLGFEAIAPLLWLRAGGVGERIDSATEGFAVADTYAILFAMDAAAEFVSAVRATEDLRIAYIVTDDEAQFQALVAQIPPGRVESVRLYSAYLDNFKNVRDE
jgi:adenine-specific DNA-methyltransferase